MGQLREPDPIYFQISEVPVPPEDCIHNTVFLQPNHALQYFTLHYKTLLSELKKNYDPIEKLKTIEGSSLIIPL
jgi:hypothetical protein